jgi:protoporphyrinogen oxidase
VYEKMAQQVRQRGGQVHLRSPVGRVVREGFEVRGLELAGERFEAFDHVISTMPLTLLVRGLGDSPADVADAVAALRFRNTILVYLQVDAQNLFPDQWLYVHSPELLMGRVTNFRNWVPELYGQERTTILAAEFWCYESDDLWRERDEQLVDRAARELGSTGLLRGAKVLGGHVIRVPRCYPVYARGYKRHVERIAEWLGSFSGLTAIGRYGAFKYNNQDHSILMGVLAAENLLSGATHDLWSINTDYESYQESSRITETGLELDETKEPAIASGAGD